MTYLVDSDWIADYLDGRPPAIALVNRLAPDGLAISIITYAEIYEGIYYRRDPVRAERVLQGLLQGVRVLPISRPVACRYARIRGSLRRQGHLIA